MLNRRNFIRSLVASLVVAPSLSRAGDNKASLPKLLPKRLSTGSKVAIVTPASAVFDPMDLQIAKESFEAIGLEVVVGKHALDRFGYLAGTDENRAADVNAAFADPSVDGIIALRGGWGCNRILPLLDYASIAANPKILLGYSDITSLLNAIYAKTGMVSFHGPVGISYWSDFQVEQLKQQLFDAQATVMRNYQKDTKPVAMRENRTRTITGGKAKGILVGGNLTVMTTMVGSPYMPDMRGKILMLEDVGESIYRIDRYLSTLKLAGILDQLAGIVFGHCNDCGPQRGGYGSFTLPEIFEQYFAPLKIPTYTGAQFGHIRDNHILAVGAEVEIDADAGTLKMLSPSVKKNH
ncbi:S66 peptidase family protein [Glaciecola sp. 1036]|uniref:S66 peptidase family protein n=1 Tax=Alteromonadaceae TaxID=72275 RepID=UPI003D01DC64